MLHDPKTISLISTHTHIYSRHPFQESTSVFASNFLRNTLCEHPSNLFRLFIFVPRPPKNLFQILHCCPARKHLQNLPCAVYSLHSGTQTMWRSKFISMFLYDFSSLSVSCFFLIYTYIISHNFDTHRTLF